MNISHLHTWEHSQVKSLIELYVPNDFSGNLLSLLFFVNCAYCIRLNLNLMLHTAYWALICNNTLSNLCHWYRIQCCYILVWPSVKLNFELFWNNGLNYYTKNVCFAFLYVTFAIFSFRLEIWSELNYTLKASFYS